MISRALLLASLLASCGVEETGLLLCPPGTTSTIDGCEPVGETGSVHFSELGDFGRVPVGGTYRRRMILSNDSSEPKTIELVAVDGASNVFALNDFVLGEPAIVSEQRTATIDFVPGSGEAEATFHFNACVDEGNCRVSRRAHGVGVDEAFRCVGTDLGDVPLGECGLGEIICTNVTDIDVEISSIVFDTGEFTPLVTPPSSTGPGQEVTIEIQFCPADIGPRESQFLIEARVPAGLNVSRTFVRGSGSAAENALLCEPLFVTLGPVDVETHGHATVSCRAQRDLVIQALEFRPGQTRDLFAMISIDGQVSMTPAFVGPGSNIEIELDFFPQEQGQFRDSLRIEHDGGVVRIDIEAMTPATWIATDAALPSI